MPDTVSKTDNFLKAIEKYAEQQRTKIQSEAEDFKEKELTKAEDEGLREAYVLIQKKMTDIKVKIASELSRAENASRKKTFVRRQEIENEVFEEAEKKLIEYTKTDEYLKRLKNSAKQTAQKLTSEDTVLFVKESDLKYSDELQKAFGRQCRVESSDDIIIGGMIGISHTMGLLVDETIDSRLQQQREWFFENSGLKVTG